MAQAERWLKLLLRAAGGLMLLATLALFMPTRWMEICHERLGLGAFPDQPIVEYLARTTSALYALLGALLLLASCDVKRYARVITVVAVGLIPMSVVIWAYMLAGDGRMGLYLIADVLSAVPFAAAVLILQARIRRSGGSG